MSRRDLVIGGSFVAVVTALLCSVAWAMFEMGEVERQKQRVEEANERADRVRWHPCPVVTPAECPEPELCPTCPTCPECEPRVRCATGREMPESTCMLIRLETIDGSPYGNVDAAYHLPTRDWVAMGNMSTSSGMGEPEVGLQLWHGDWNMLWNGGGKPRFEDVSRIQSHNGKMTFFWRVGESMPANAAIQLFVCGTIDWERMKGGDP